MMKRRAMLLLGSALFVLAACGETPREGHSSAPSQGNSSSGGGYQSMGDVSSAASTSRGGASASDSASKSEEKPTGEGMTLTEMREKLSANLALDQREQSVGQYKKTFESHPYRSLDVDLSSEETYQVNLLPGGGSLAQGSLHKAKKQDGATSSDVTEPYLEKRGKDENYLYRVRIFDHPHEGLTDFENEATRTALSEVGEADLLRRQSQCVSAVALDILDFLFPDYSPTIDTFPPFEKTVKDGKDIYKATRSIENQGNSDETYVERYLYTVTLTYESGTERLVDVASAKTWKCYYDGETTAGAEEYTTWHYEAAFSGQSTPAKDLNFLDYFLVSFTGVQLYRFNPGRVDVAADNLPIGAVLYAYATGVSPATAVNKYLSPVSTSNKDAVYLNSQGLFYVASNPGGQADLTWASQVTPSAKFTISVKVTDERLVPTAIREYQAKASRFYDNVQEFEDVTYLYLGRAYNGFRINITNAVQDDPSIDVIVSDPSIAEVNEDAALSGMQSGNLYRHYYNYSLKKEGNLNVTYAAHQDHNVKLEKNYVIKQGKTAEELKSLLLSKQWEFVHEDEGEADPYQRVVLTFDTDGHCTMNVFSSATAAAPTGVGYTTYTLTDFTLKLDTFYDSIDALDDYSYAYGDEFNIVGGPGSGQIMISGEALYLSESTKGELRFDGKDKA